MGLWDDIRKSKPLKEVGKLLREHAPETGPIVDRIDTALRKARQEQTPVGPALERGFARGAADVALDRWKPWIIGGAAVVAVILFARQR